MVRRLNESFDDVDHIALKLAKKTLAIKYNLEKLSWRDYILHISGIRELK